MGRRSQRTRVLAYKHVYQLREFVDAGGAQQLPDTRLAGIAFWDRAVA
jgi:hypothetical protein